MKNRTTNHGNRNTRSILAGLGLAATLLFAGCASAPAAAPRGPSLPPVELANAPSAPVQHDELDDGLAWIVDEAHGLARDPSAPSTYSTPLRLDPAPAPAPRPIPSPLAPDPIEQFGARRLPQATVAINRHN